MNPVEAAIQEIVDAMKRGNGQNISELRYYTARQIDRISRAFAQSGQIELALKCLNVLSQELGITPKTEKEPACEGYLNRLIDALVNANNPDLEERRFYTERGQARTQEEVNFWMSKLEK